MVRRFYINSKLPCHYGWAYGVKRWKETLQ